MPAAHPEEFRRRAVELARLREKLIAAIAKDIGISESCLRRWMAVDGTDRCRRRTQGGPGQRRAGDVPTTNVGDGVAW